MDPLKQRFKIARLLAEDLIGIINKVNKAELESWRKASPQNEQEYQEIRIEFRPADCYSKSPEINVSDQWKKFCHKKIHRNNIYIRHYRYAAILILLIGFTSIFLWPKGTQENQTEPVCQSISMAKGNVLLILSSGKTISLNDSTKLSDEEPLSQIQVADNMICYRGEEDLKLTEVYNTLIIPRGGEYQVLLADGSKVWLNSETEFRYPVHFTGKQRKVYLKGEAYFEVTKNQEHPFIVTVSDRINIKVLGTKFNISSYEDQEKIVTTLTEGCVEISQTNQTKQAIRILPDEQLLFDKNDQTFQARKVNAAIYSAWKDGKFIFNERPLEEIMKQLQRWYEMKVIYADEAARNCHLSGDLKKYDDFDKIVKMIKEVTNLQIDIKNERVVIRTK